MDFSILCVHRICTVYASLHMDMILSMKVLLSDIGKLLALLLYYEERGVSQVG
ncbi:hypothetical protein [Anaplasma phagocytophilum]|uniref:Uncharacterized protein n=1 Tax=Anaplasma phagocytophilum str. ApWI1 TaxID=1359155 RepID=A0A0F3PX49_ANAPH|nr:hypothetical protein [Anaplasma phagocytophilum]KJZ99144.1 hypothetical protein APHCR_0114 [Anaplasma phagocytophilum str. CR1007]AGR79394.1 hypothetical protein YYU_02890 [Anaplasma phagocytophilum str. HZ2]AGR80640.1 hypothetical protein WSQ_02885 [Anaplasma phagocytophilum str. JM]AGR81896.1 hypothetical protein YYY_02890 [Anaplasma phagocytophilum str. Dog2]KJV60057.1 hypothetical protein APHWEB_1422 [Anaplasma phagocytophilum str. Webster]